MGQEEVGGGDWSVFLVTLAKLYHLCKMRLAPRSCPGSRYPDGVKVESKVQSAWMMVCTYRVFVLWPRKLERSLLGTGKLSTLQPSSPHGSVFQVLREVSLDPDLSPFTSRESRSPGNSAPDYLPSSRPHCHCYVLALIAPGLKGFSFKIKHNYFCRK